MNKNVIFCILISLLASCAAPPYLWNAQTRQFVSYDDEESVRIKCGYVKEHGMAGVMFWQYSSDPKEYLLTAIHETRKTNQ